MEQGLKIKVDNVMNIFQSAVSQDAHLDVHKPSVEMLEFVLPQIEGDRGIFQS